MNTHRTSSTSSCPVCGGVKMREFLSITQVPVYCNVLWPDQETARTAPRGDLKLCFCQTCGHVFNRTFDPGLVDYTVEYENSLHYSPRFQQYAEELARDLIQRHDLHGKSIVEIACGKGDFMRLLCDLGNNQGYGFDPSYEHDRDDAETDNRIRFVSDYYGPAHADYPADLICCRHALEHIPQATTFLRGLRESLGENGDTVVFFEVPNSLYSLRDLGIWDFIYEHPSYFWAGSLARAFTTAGFSVQDVRETYGGQFLTCEARAGRSQAKGPESGGPHRFGNLAQVEDYVDALPARYAEQVTTWRQRLDELAAAGRQAAVWGGGSKGVTFLNVLGAGPEVSCVVDINPHKQGKFVAGSGLPVVAPAGLLDNPPALIIVMNPLYQDEIRGMVKDLGIEAELVPV